MTFQEAIKSNKAFAEDWKANLGSLTYEIANSANSLMKLRITQQGMNADNQAFDPYSTEPMLANCSSMTTEACNKVAGSAAKRKNLRWVTLKRGNRNIRLFELAGGYKEFRELHGRQTGFVDFAFSGRMWADVQVISTNAEHQEGRARIGTLSEEQNKKLEGNTARRGDILELSDQEINILQKTIEVRIAELMSKHNML